MKRIVFSLLIIVLAFTQLQLGYAEPRLKLGAILSLSGDYAYVGQYISQGIDLGLTDAGTKNEIQVLYEDLGVVDKAKAVRAFHKFMSTDKVDLILTQSTSEAGALLPLSRLHQMPLIIVWDHNQLFEVKDAPVLAFGYSTEKAAEDMAEYVFNTLGIKNYAVVSLQDPWSELISSEFVKQYKKRGGKILWHETVSDTTSDMRGIALKLRQVPGVYAPLYFTPLYSLLKTLKQESYSGQVSLADGLVEGDFDNLGSALENAVFTQMWVSDQKFLRRIQEATGKPYSPLSASFFGLGYDLAQMISKIVGEHPQHLSRNELVSILRKTDFTGISGRSNFNQTFSEKREALLRYRNGKIEKINDFKMR